MQYMIQLKYHIHHAVYDTVKTYGRQCTQCVLYMLLIEDFDMKSDTTHEIYTLIMI